MSQKSPVYISIPLLICLLCHAELPAQVSKTDTTIHKTDTTIYEKVDQKATYRGSWLNHFTK